MRPLQTGVVMVSGAFDPFHEGHRAYFKQARSFGTRLVCVIARDQTIERQKHRIAWHNEQARLNNIAAEPLVDIVVLGDQFDPFVTLERIAPEVICVGYDQTVFIDRLSIELAMRGMNTRIERVHAYAPERYKSSFIRTLSTLE